MFIPGGSLLPFLLLFGAFFMAGCAAAPSEQAVEETLVRHFEERGYRVIALELGAIEPISTGERSYMGTPAYAVGIRMLTLEGIGSKQSTAPLVFMNSIVRIREKPGRKGEWLVYRVEGIPVP